ncbi:MAG: patatin-like phospholipase family protein [Bacteroidota bacterium]
MLSDLPIPSTEASKSLSPGVGVVLSGGGVRGVGHLGVLQVMEECGIYPAYISGTSAGALVGAFYAAGHSIQTTFEFFKNTPIFKPSHFYTRKPGLIDTDRFIPILKEYFPEDDFLALQRKLYVTATDLIHGRSKTFHEGELIKPLLASAALPVVFSPVEIGGTLYTDGGALNNFPVEPLTGQCDVIVGINVHPLKDTLPEHIRSTFGVLERIFHLTVFYQSVQKYHLCNLTIVPQGLASVRTLERGRFEEIFEMGYQAAHEKRADLMALKST